MLDELFLTTRPQHYELTCHSKDNLAHGNDVLATPEETEEHIPSTLLDKVAEFKCADLCVRDVLSG